MSAALPPLLGMGVSLNGTLNGMDVQSRADALEEELRRQVAARSQAAAQESAAAGQAYQQAAGAPVQQVPPMEAFLNTLIGNVAGTLAQDPRFQQRAQGRIQDRQAELLKSRTDNLTALRDVYSQKAELAQRAGDLEATEKFRLQQEKISKLNEQLMQKLKNDQAIELENLRQDNRLELEGAKQQNRASNIQANKKAAAASYDPEAVQAAVDDLAEGRTRPSDYRKGFFEVVQTEQARQQKRIMPQKVRAALDEIGAAETVVDELDALSQQLNTARGGFDRFGKGAKLAFEAWTQKSGNAAQFETTRNGLAGNLARAISAERGVLTDQDRRYAVALMPSLYDSQEVAQLKIGMLKRFIAKRKARAMNAYTGTQQQLAPRMKGIPDYGIPDEPGIGPTVSSERVPTAGMAQPDAPADLNAPAMEPGDTQSKVKALLDDEGLDDEGE